MLLTTRFPALAQLTLWTIALRLLLSAVCGGVVGFEREQKGRPAGFRTHILVCVGSTLCMMINQYLPVLGESDLARLGAGVISGIGFLGAGTILVTRKNHVTGLSTAAGLWASAAIGLAIGIGFYEAALLTCLIILIAQCLLEQVSQRAAERAASRRHLVKVHRMTPEQITVYRARQEQSAEEEPPSSPQDTDAPKM